MATISFYLKIMINLTQSELNRKTNYTCNKRQKAKYLWTHFANYVLSGKQETPTTFFKSNNI